MNICAEVGSTNESIAREVKTFEDLEIIIGRGLQSFFEVGQALATIRDNNLYKAEYKTFENYCRLRWQLTPQHAGRQIKAAEIVKIIEPIGSIPIAESQVRPLFDLNPDQQRATWKAAVTASRGKVPTAAEVKATRDELYPPAQPEPPPPPVRDHAETLDAFRDFIRSLPPERRRVAWTWINAFTRSDYPNEL